MDEIFEEFNIKDDDTSLNIDNNFFSVLRLLPEFTSKSPFELNHLDTYISEDKSDDTTYDEELINKCPKNCYKISISKEVEDIRKKYIEKGITLISNDIKNKSFLSDDEKKYMMELVNIILKNNLVEFNFEPLRGMIDYTFHIYLDFKKKQYFFQKHLNEIEGTDDEIYEKLEKLWDLDKNKKVDKNDYCRWINRVKGIFVHEISSLFLYDISIIEKEKIEEYLIYEFQDVVIRALHNCKNVITLYFNNYSKCFFGAFYVLLFGNERFIKKIKPLDSPLKNKVAGLLKLIAKYLFKEKIDRFTIFPYFDLMWS